MQNKNSVSYKVKPKTAHCPTLWEQDIKPSKNDNIRKSEMSGCPQYGCGCFVGYLFK